MADYLPKSDLTASAARPPPLDECMGQAGSLTPASPPLGADLSAVAPVVADALGFHQTSTARQVVNAGTAGGRCTAGVHH